MLTPFASETPLIQFVIEGIRLRAGQAAAAPFRQRTSATARLQLVETASARTVLLAHGVLSVQLRFQRFDGKIFLAEALRYFAGSPSGFSPAQLSHCLGA